MVDGLVRNLEDLPGYSTTVRREIPLARYFSGRDDRNLNPTLNSLLLVARCLVADAQVVPANAVGPCYELV